MVVASNPIFPASPARLPLSSPTGRSRICTATPRQGPYPEGRPLPLLTYPGIRPNSRLRIVLDIDRWQPPPSALAEYGPANADKRNFGLTPERSADASTVVRSSGSGWHPGIIECGAAQSVGGRDMASDETQAGDAKVS